MARQIGNCSSRKLGGVPTPAAEAELAEDFTSQKV